MSWVIEETDCLGAGAPARPDAPSPASLTSSARAAEPQDWRARQIQEWLLQLLQFAITRNPKDEAAALALANAIDSLALQQGSWAPSFFRRTTREVCGAITAPDYPDRTMVLTRHLARVEDVRLRRALRAAFDLKEPAPLSTGRSTRQHLWVGLPR